MSSKNSKSAISTISLTKVVPHLLCECTLQFSDMFRTSTLGYTSILHEVKPGFRWDYIEPEIVFGRICLFYISIRIEWVTDAATGDVDITIFTDDFKMECRTESGVYLCTMALNASH